MYDSGTDEYISNLVRKYSPALLRAAFSVLRNTADAQDAAQEAGVADPGDGERGENHAESRLPYGASRGKHGLCV